MIAKHNAWYRERNERICKMYSDQLLTLDEISAKTGIVKSWIAVILRENGIYQVPNRRIRYHDAAQK
jgi:hypothetical protein